MSSTLPPQRSGRHTKVHQLVGELKAYLAAYRFYGAGHEILADMCNTLFRTLSDDLAEHEQLDLEVTALTLGFEGRALVEAASQKESLTYPLFLDGVQLIIFDEGVQPRELADLVRVWAAAIDAGDDALNSFVTDFWEAEFDYVRLVAIDNFYEGTDEQSIHAAQRQHSALVARMCGDAALTFSADQRPLATYILRGDNALLDEAGLRRMGSEELKRRDRRNAAAVYGLSDKDATATLAALATNDVEVLQHFFRCIGLAVQTQHQAHVAQIQQLVERVLMALAERGHFELLAACVSLTMPAEGHDPRASVLVHPSFLGTVMKGLRNDNTQRQALQTLLHVPVEAVGLLLDGLIHLKPSEGRSSLALLVQAKHPPAELLAARIGLCDTDLALKFMAIADGYEEHDRRRIYKAALRHRDAEVRYGVLGAIDHARYDVMRPELHQLLDDADAHVRREALNMVMRFRDRGAVRMLATRMSREGIAVEEQRLMIAALGRLGGDSAGRALRNEFEVNRDGRMRAMVLLALTRAEGEDARPLLTKYATKRFLVNRQVKDAAIEGLKRLDAKLGKPAPAAAASSAPARPPGHARDPFASEPSDAARYPGYPSSPAMSTQSLGTDAPPSPPLSPPSTHTPNTYAPPSPHTPNTYAPPSPHTPNTYAPPPDSHAPDADAPWLAAVPYDDDDAIAVPSLGLGAAETVTDSRATTQRAAATAEVSAIAQLVETALSERPLAAAGVEPISIEPPGDAPFSVPTVPSPATSPPPATPAPVRARAMSSDGAGSRPATAASSIAPASKAVALPSQRPRRRPSVVMASSAVAPSTSDSGIDEVLSNAQRAIDSDHLDEAVSLLRGGLRQHSNCARLYTLLADAQELNGQLDEAIESLYQAVLAAPSRSDLAERLWRLRRSKEDSQ